MCAVMDLCLQIYNILTDNIGDEKIIQIISQDLDHVVVHRSESIDVGIPKAVYLSIFKQAHDYWHQHAENFRGNLNVVSTELLMEMYMVTICYLLTTNDHHVIMNHHERVLIEIYTRNPDILQIEFELISTLISSRMPKINKNSLLWHLMKKLTILLIFDNLIPPEALSATLIRRVFNSCNFHFANYYANNFLAWFIIANALHGNDNSLAINKLVTNCRANLRDVSLWTNIKKLVDSKCMIIDEYNLMINDINEKFNKDLKFLEPTVSMESLLLSRFIKDELDWLFKVKCVSKPPYILLLTKETKPLISNQLEKEINQLLKLDKLDFIYETQKRFITTLEFVNSINL